MNKAERIAALIANKKTAFTDADKAYLETWDEDRLAAAESHVKEEAKPEVKQEEPKVAEKKEEPKAKTEAEVLAELPKGIRDTVARAMAREQKEKDELVTKLAAAQKVYSEAELKAMDIDALGRVAQLVKVETPAVDFSLGAGSVRAAAEVKEDKNPFGAGKVESLTDRIRAARAK